MSVLLDEESNAITRFLNDLRHRHGVPPLRHDYRTTLSASAWALRLSYTNDIVAARVTENVYHAAVPEHASNIDVLRIAMHAWCRLEGPRSLLLSNASLVGYGVARALDEPMFVYVIMRFA